MRRGVLLRHSIAILIFLCIVSTGLVSAQEKKLLFRDDFNDLENWKPLHFPKIKTYSRYSIEKDGDESYLRAESSASASAIVYRSEYNVFDYPDIRWSWKINNVYKKGDSREKSGDDYPIRIYIFFKYDPERASFGERIKYNLARIMYGEYPPYSSLNYIWESRKQDYRIIVSPFAAESMMIILQTGDGNAGKWMEQNVNIIDDYHEAFGKDPPRIASIAIMNDSDNTGESSVSYIDYIEVFRK
jgi:hypothetical protein